MASYGTLNLKNPSKRTFKFSFNLAYGGREYEIKPGQVVPLPEEIALFGAYKLAQRELRSERGSKFVLRAKTVREYSSKFIVGDEVPVEDIEVEIKEVIEEPEEEAFSDVQEEPEEIKELTEDEEELLAENNPKALEAHKLNELTVTELMELANERNVEIKSNARKAEIIETIVNA